MLAAIYSAIVARLAILVVIDPWCACRFPWLMRTDIPPLLQYPVGDAAFPFVCGLISMFYGLNVRDNVAGLLTVLKCFLCGSKPAEKKRA